MSKVENFTDWSAAIRRKRGQSVKIVLTREDWERVVVKKLPSFIDRMIMRWVFRLLVAAEGKSGRIEL